MVRTPSLPPAAQTLQESRLIIDQALKAAENVLYGPPSSSLSLHGRPSRSLSSARSAFAGALPSSGANRKKGFTSPVISCRSQSAKSAIRALRECRRALHQLSSYLLLAGSVTKASGISAHVERLLKTIQSRLVFVLAAAIPFASSAGSLESIKQRRPGREKRKKNDEENHRRGTSEEPRTSRKGSSSGASTETKSFERNHREEEASTAGFLLDTSKTEDKTISSSTARERTRERNSFSTSSSLASSVFSASSFTSSASQREFLALDDCGGEMPVMFPYRTGSPSIARTPRSSQRSGAASIATSPSNTPRGLCSSPFPGTPREVSQPSSHSPVPCSSDREEARREIFTSQLLPLTHELTAAFSTVSSPRNETENTPEGLALHDISMSVTQPALPPQDEEGNPSDPVTTVPSDPLLVLPVSPSVVVPRSSRSSSRDSSRHNTTCERTLEGQPQQSFPETITIVQHASHDESVAPAIQDHPHSMSSSHSPSPLAGIPSMSRTGLAPPENRSALAVEDAKVVRPEENEEVKDEMKTETFHELSDAVPPMIEKQHHLSSPFRSSVSQKGRRENNLQESVEEEPMVWDAEVEDSVTATSRSSHRSNKKTSSGELLWSMEDEQEHQASTAFRVSGELQGRWKEKEEIQNPAELTAEREALSTPARLPPSTAVDETQRDRRPVAELEHMQEIEPPFVAPSSHPLGSLPAFSLEIPGAPPIVDPTPLSSHTIPKSMAGTANTTIMMSVGMRSTTDSQLTQANERNSTADSHRVEDSRLFPPSQTMNRNDRTSSIQLWQESSLMMRTKLPIGNDTVLQEMLAKKEEENEHLLEKLSDMASELMRLTELQEKRSEEQSKKMVTLTSDHASRLAHEKSMYAFSLEAKLLKQKETLMEEEQQRTKGFILLLEWYGKRLQQLTDQLQVHVCSEREDWKFALRTTRDQEKRRKEKSRAANAGPHYRQLVFSGDVAVYFRHHPRRRIPFHAADKLFWCFGMEKSWRRRARNGKEHNHRVAEQGMILHAIADTADRAEEHDKQAEKETGFDSVNEEMDWEDQDWEDPLGGGGGKTWQARQRGIGDGVASKRAWRKEVNQPPLSLSSLHCCSVLVGEYKKRVEQLIREREDHEKALEDAREEVQALQRQLNEQTEEQEKFFTKIAEYEIQLLEGEKQRKVLNEKLRETIEHSDKVQCSVEAEQDAERESGVGKETAESNVERKKDPRRRKEEGEGPDKSDTWVSSSYSRGKIPVGPPQHSSDTLSMLHYHGTFWNPESRVPSTAQSPGPDGEPVSGFAKGPSSPEKDKKEESLEDLFLLLLRKEREVHQMLENWKKWEPFFHSHKLGQVDRYENGNAVPDTDEETRNTLVFHNLYLGPPLNTLIASDVFVEDSVFEKRSSHRHSNAEMWKKMMIVMSVVLQQGFSVTASCYAYHCRLHEAIKKQIHLQLLVLSKLLIFLFPVPFQHTSSVSDEKGEEPILGKSPSTSFYPPHITPSHYVEEPSSSLFSTVTEHKSSKVSSPIENKALPEIGWNLLPTIFTSCSQLVCDMIIHAEPLLVSMEKVS